MAPTIAEIEEQIRALSTADKAEILRMLILVGWTLPVQ
jgi:hypothetical protein